MAQNRDEGFRMLVRSILPGSRLFELMLLWTFLAVELVVFSPYYGDAGASAFPLALIIAATAIPACIILVAYRNFRNTNESNLLVSEFWLFILGTMTALLTLTLFTAEARSAPLWSVAGIMAFLFLLMASALHTRMLDKGVRFTGPVLAGLLWPLLIPFNRVVEYISQRSPWIFDSLTFTAIAAIFLMVLMATYLKSRIRITVPYGIVWAFALALMTLVPFHEIFGVFSNSTYGSVDRSVALGGLIVGILTVSLFVRRNLKAGTLRRELETGDNLHRNGKHRAAIEHYDRALILDPGRADAWTRKELAFKALGDNINVEKCLRKVLEFNPGSEGALNEMGILSRRKGKLKEAISFFNKALEQNPDFVTAWNNKGNTYHKLRELKKAIKCYDRALGLNPRYEKAYVNKARALSAMGRYRAALDSMDRALRVNSGSEANWNEKGLIFMKMGKHEDALAHFDKALKLQPKAAAGWNNRGNALLGMGRTADAIACYNRALQLDIEYATAWFNEGSALIDAGDVSGAVKCLDEALRIEPSSEVAWNERGVAMRKLGRYRDAGEHFSRALRINPNYAAAWNNQGNALMDQGRTADAYHSYNIATIIEPDYDKAWYNKGCALLSLGSAQEAMTCFEKSISAQIEQVVQAKMALNEMEGCSEILTVNESGLQGTVEPGAPVAGPPGTPISGDNAPARHPEAPQESKV